MNGRSHKILIVTYNQLLPSFGGVERVGSILADYFRKSNLETFVAFKNSFCSISDNDILLGGEDPSRDGENYNIIKNLICTHDIDVILCLSHIGWQLDLCYNIKEDCPVKLIYAYHRNPFAATKEFDDFIDKKTLNIQNPVKRSFTKLYYRAKRSRWENKKLIEVANDFRSYRFDLLDAFVMLNNKDADFVKVAVGEGVASKVCVVRNPVYTIGDREKNSENVKQRSVVFVGRLTWQKRVDRLLRIWRLIESSDKFNDWNLIIVGDGDCRQFYENLAKRLSLKNVSFEGSKPSEEYLKRASMLCLVSSHEGLPMVLLEALKFGCVPLSFGSYNSVSDIIEHGVNGYIIKPFNLKQYAESLMGLMSNSGLRLQMVSNAHKTLSKFDTSVIGAQWIKLFENL